MSKPNLAIEAIKQAMDCIMVNIEKSKDPKQILSKSQQLKGLTWVCLHLEQSKATRKAAEELYSQLWDMIDDLKKRARKLEELKQEQEQKQTVKIEQ